MATETTEVVVVNGYWRTAWEPDGIDLASSRPRVEMSPVETLGGDLVWDFSAVLTEAGDDRAAATALADSGRRVLAMTPCDGATRATMLAALREGGYTVEG